VIVSRSKATHLDGEVLRFEVGVESDEVALCLVEQRRDRLDLRSIREPVLDHVKAVVVVPVRDAQEYLVSLHRLHARIVARARITGLVCGRARQRGTKLMTGPPDVA
jgi:hypothetical protein